MPDGEWMTEMMRKGHLGRRKIKNFVDFKCREFKHNFHMQILLPKDFQHWKCQESHHLHQPLKQVFQRQVVTLPYQVSLPLV